MDIWNIGQRIARPELRSCRANLVRPRGEGGHLFPADR